MAIIAEQVATLVNHQLNNKHMNIFLKTLIITMTVCACNFAGYAQFQHNANGYTYNISTSDNVGIGTNSTTIPESKLTIVGGTSTLPVGLKIRHVNEDPSWGISIGQNSNLSAGISAAGRDLQITSGWSNTLILGSSQYSQYNGKVVFPGGRVGIGTSQPDPGATLHVFGTSILGTSGISWTYFNSLNGGRIRSTGEGYLMLESNPNGAGDKNMYFNTYSGDFIFSRDGATKLSLTTTGTATRLNLKGSLYCREMVVDLNVPGPDYVFDDSYELPNLRETENYIKEHKHLPEMPSACEMESDGINVSKMNMLLLKKVEELTLHLIELNKRSELQTKLIAQQQAEIGQLKKAMED
jgi:hypothetical protein